MDSPARILVIRLGAMGDLLCSTPVVTNLRRNFPKSWIAFLVEDRYKEVLEGNPYLDETILFSRSHSFFQRIFDELRLLWKIRQKNFDLTIDLLGTLRTALLSFLSGSNRRVGFTYRIRKLFYNILVEAKNPQYVADFNLDTLRILGLNISTKDLIFTIPDEARRFGKDFLSRNEDNSSKRLIGFFPGGGWAAKRWKEEKFAILGEKIQMELGYKILLLGGPEEKEVLSEIASQMTRKPMILEGVSLQQFAGVLENLDLFIGNDSGPVYIAVALRIPTITLFGPTDANNATPPDGRHIAISRNAICKNPNALTCDLPDCCLQSIEVEEVMEKVSEILN